MRDFLIRLSNQLSPLMSKYLRGLRVYLKSKHAFTAWKLYTLSDETNKFQHITEAVNYVRVAGANNRLPQTYFEFGCHSGRTFSAAVNAANYLGLKNFEFHAFDSFQGLPETSDEDGFLKREHLKLRRADFLKIVKKRTGMSLSLSSIHRGFYSESLNAELLPKLPKIGVVHVDVDLYSATLELFEFIKPLLCDE